MNCQEGLATYTTHSNYSATVDSILAITLCICYSYNYRDNLG